MAFTSSRSSIAWVDHMALAAYARSGSVTSNLEPLDVTTWADGNKTFIPGKTNGAFSCDGPLDTDATADAFFDALADELTTTSTAVTFAPLGNVDYSLWLVNIVESSLETSASQDGTADWSLSGQPTGQIDMAGSLIDNAVTVTIDTNGTAHTGPTGGTSNGACFHLHVTAYATLTSDDIIVEGSTSGSFSGEETTIATFTQVTGVTSERVEVTGTVPRYLRVVDDVTGSGSITRTVAVSRR